MKNLLLILVLSLFSIQSFAGSCPDGSDPVKSISADGTYYVFNCNGNNTVNNSTSNKNAISPISQGTYTHNNKYHSEPPFYFALARMLNTRMPIAKIHGKGEAFQLSKIEGVVETNELFVKNQVERYPDKERWNAKLHWDFVEIKEKVKWIHSPSDLVEDFISVDLDNDGDKDWLVFLYGFTQVRKDKSSDIYKNCENPGCVSGDVVFPVVAFLTDENGNIQGPQDAGQFFVSGNAPYVKNARMIRIADINGDTIDDYIIADGGWDNPPHGFRPSYQSHIFMSKGDKFKHVEFGILDKAHGLAVGDIDNDGDQDIIVSYVNSPNIYINDGKGNFKYKETIRVGFHSFIELEDFDSDGDLDLLLNRSSCGQQPNRSNILKNNGKGSFLQWDTINLPIEKAKRCSSVTLGGDDNYWDDNFSMIHHLIKFDDKFLLLTSNNHQGWGFTTLQKNGKNLKIMNSGKFKKENVEENHFPYKVMLDKDKVIIFDFNFKPYYFEFNHDTGELIQQLKEIESIKNIEETEEESKELSFHESQIELLTDQRRLQVCGAVFSEFFGDEYYKRTNRDTYFFVSLDSNGKDCHYEWSTNEMTAFQQCEENTKSNGKCTIYAIGDTAVWGNPKLYEDLRSQ